MDKVKRKRINFTSLTKCDTSIVNNFRLVSAILFQVPIHFVGTKNSTALIHQILNLMFCRIVKDIPFNPLPDDKF